jgi:hypothetical protein
VCRSVRHRGRPYFPVSESLVILCACAIRCTGRTPRDRDRGRAARRIGEAKGACAAALVQGLTALGHPPKYANAPRTHDSYAHISRAGSKRPWPAALGRLQEARAGVLRVTRIITRLSPWSWTGTICSCWRSRAGFVNRRSYSAARIARSEDAGDDESSHRCLTAAGASRWRFPLTGRCRRDSIRALAATGQTSSPHRCSRHLHGPNPQHGVTHVSG